jgi:hypothetical protein
LGVGDGSAVWKSKPGTDKSDVNAGDGSAGSKVKAGADEVNVNTVVVELSLPIGGDAYCALCVVAREVSKSGRVAVRVVILARDADEEGPAALATEEVVVDGDRTSVV